MPRAQKLATVIGGTKPTTKAKSVAVSIPKKSAVKKEAATPRPKATSRASKTVVSAQSSTATNKARTVKIANNTKAEIAKQEAARVLAKPTKAKNEKATAHISVLDKTPEEARVVIVRERLSVALLSPFRFPMLSDKTVAQVARIAGVAFVVIGAFFTLLNMQYAVGSYATETAGSTASTIDATGIQSQYDCTDPLGANYNADFCQGGSGTGTLGDAIATPPEISLAVDATEPLTGVVPVNVTVANASQVYVLAYYENEATHIQVGSTSRIDDLHWRVLWDTRQFRDGDYHFKVIVNNSAFGSYSRVFDTQYTVENIAPTDTVGSGSGSDTDATVATSSQDTLTDSQTIGTNVSFTIDDNAPLKDSVMIFITAVGATNVKIYAKNVDTGVAQMLGYATYKGSGRFEYEWDTNKSQNGSYEVRGVIQMSSGNFTTPVIETTVDNDEQTAATAAPTDAQTAIVPDTAFDTPTAATLVPSINIQIPESNPISGDTDVLVNVTGATFVEIYAIPNNSLEEKFLGLAQQRSSADWRFRWYTSKFPNGKYDVFARVKHTNGLSDSSKLAVSVYNQIVVQQTETQKTYVSDLQSVTGALEQETDTIDTGATSDDATQIAAQPVVKTVYIEPIREVVNSTDLNDDEKDTLDAALEDFRDKLDSILTRYGRAIRENNVADLRDVEDDISKLREDIISTLPVSKERADILERVTRYLDDTISALTELTKRNEEIIKARIGDAITTDTDTDGISDYDEVNLYRTDPFSADTDSDGFIDGSEVLGGYDPTNASSETIVAYESPREFGTVREDLLVVETVSTLPKGENEVDTDGVATEAVITGRSLPNSFVSLHIFSTPIVVTVKTDAEGAWSYIFDKELDDGNHEVYASITDNAGRIVAKSNPFPFVKTAEAFTPIDAAATVENSNTTTDEPSLINEFMLLAIGSIAIVGLGLVLILIGLHVHRREDLVPSYK